VRKLGRHQVHVLDALVRHGPWQPGCGWSYGGGYETAIILDSLVRRELATRTEPPTSAQYGRYEITDAGRAARDAARGSP
jgi:hypothetical protein